MMKMILAAAVLALGTTTVTAQSTPGDSIGFGYLKGSIPTYEGAGCSYFKESDQKLKQPKPVAADDRDGKGLIFNINGTDMLFKEKSRTARRLVVERDGLVLILSDGKQKRCGEECMRTFIDVEIQKPGRAKERFPIYSMCGS